MRNATPPKAVTSTPFSKSCHQSTAKNTTTPEGIRTPNPRFRRPEADCPNPCEINDLREELDGQAVDREWHRCGNCHESTLTVKAPNETPEVLARNWARLSGQLQAAILGIVESPEVALSRDHQLPSLAPVSSHYIEQLARSLAHRCRSIVQCCLREEEWIDADGEFFAIIQEGLQEVHGVAVKNRSTVSQNDLYGTCKD